MLTGAEIINNAIQEYKPFKVFALFSGGNDSVCAAHVASQASKFDGVVYIDTGIKLQETFDHARETANKFGWPFQVVKTTEDYDDLVLKYGFPGPAAHRYMYIWLKERAIRKLIRDTKTNRNQRILLITGVRKHESKRRMENVTSPIVKEGAKVWVSPLWEWTDEIKSNYIQDHSLPTNKAKNIIHVSGDCLCGAYNDKGDLEMLKAFYPDEAARIERLQNQVMETHPWAWDEQPPKWWQNWLDGQNFLSTEFMPLCWQCNELAAQQRVHLTPQERRRK